MDLSAFVRRASGPVETRPAARLPPDCHRRCPAGVLTPRGRPPTQSRRRLRAGRPRRRL